MERKTFKCSSLFALDLDQEQTSSKRAGALLQWLEEGRFTSFKSSTQQISFASLFSGIKCGSDQLESRRGAKLQLHNWIRFVPPANPRSEALQLVLSLRQNLGKSSQGILKSWLQDMANQIFFCFCGGLDWESTESTVLFCFLVFWI